MNDYTYKLCKDSHGNLFNTILRLPDNTYIPNDENNSDYKEYLKWVAEGNTPQPADE